MLLTNILFTLFSFKGRISRQSYFLGWIILLVAGFLFIWLPNQIPLLSVDNLASKLWVLTVTAVDLIVSVLMLFGILGIHIKRFHDMNLSGWFTILFFTPLNPLVLVFCLLMPGKPSNNRFGTPV
ncbi:MAG: DUF805 domain-containing protein [Gammaproteobacteria bacterium]